MVAFYFCGGMKMAWYKNVKTGMVWEIPDENADLIKRIKQEQGEEGKPIYDETEGPKGTKK